MLPPPQSTRFPCMLHRVTLSLLRKQTNKKKKQPTTTNNNNDDGEKVQSTDTHKHRGAYKTHKHTNWKIIILKQKTSMI